VPDVRLAQVVGIQRLRLEQGLVNGTPGLGDREPISACASAVAPNIQYVQHELQQKYALSRSRTWLEYMNVRDLGRGACKQAGSGVELVLGSRQRGCGCLC
jgi:hypothetical protein